MTYYPKLSASSAWPSRTTSHSSALPNLRPDQVQEAYELIKDLEPSSPQEYILKAVVNANIGQATGSREHMKMAQQYFQLVGASATECDTIPGRQCMASCFFLLKQFEDVNIYLKSTQVCVITPGY